MEDTGARAEPEDNAGPCAASPSQGRHASGRYRSYRSFLGLGPRARPLVAAVSADVCSGGVGGGSSASQFSTCHGDAPVVCDMTNERGAGAAAAGLALATLGLIAVAAGSALIVQETRRNSRDEERRRRRAPHRLRRTALSISECDNYRFRPAPRVPVLHRQPVQMPVGDMLPLSSEALASIVAYLSMRDCVVLCRVNHTWNVAMTSLLRYAPFIKQCVRRGDLQPCRFHAWYTCVRRTISTLPLTVPPATGCT